MKDKQDFEKYAEIKSFNDKANPVWERVCRRFIDMRGGPVNLEILDYGCGDGKYLQHFGAYGIPRENIYGHEVSEIRVKRCHDKGWNNVIHIGLHKTLPFENSKFDLVNLTEVIEHIPLQNIDFYLSDIKRMMNKDAIFLISTPNYPIKRFNDWFNVLVNRMWERIKDDPTHVAFYNPKSLKKRLEVFFPHVEVVCYKQGVFYPRFKHPFFMHKILAIASLSPIPKTLVEEEIDALN